ncbi:aminotransferase class V-fold PLP-dependent enzyme [Peredibacter starrii]|uniref:Aminotransferase class V-fold PLP-dependent enzyme n=1 Tax=Peredibacter starrii TaxID=28202 RepID=A0AAX4HT44_9BACT|nr:aminotransferase class V-fold PLP-dependent enzyme [Peredibacter starrii]WPU66397.1 aminotransferase class V-fold PLP-dependent enzyme [Peredibacter starrii]
MTHSDHKRYYTRFLNGHEGKLHFAAHSHHFWPDVTREAQLRYWDDTALASDEKWNKIFGEVIPKAQKHIADILKLKDPNQIVFAPNTHELSTRLLSLFIGRPGLSILTTSNEFHSWRRQILRLSEIPEINVSIVSSENFMRDRRGVINDLKKELAKKPDVFFLSQVFFDSGVAFTDDELQEISEAVEAQTIMVVDGYHGFAAIPTNLSKLEGKIFYLGGGYKYGQGGEGVGFMVVPKGHWRPAYTGWFAEYAHLTKPAGAQVGYSDDGMAFMGATQDPSGLYRFNAAWDLFESEGLSVEAIHTYVRELQQEFLKGIPKSFIAGHNLTPLFDLNLGWHGHFLTFEAATLEEAEGIQEALKKVSVLIDRRGKRLRFGFGLYQNKADVHQVLERLGNLAVKSQ